MRVLGQRAVVRIVVGSSLLVAGLVTTGCGSDSTAVDLGPAATSTAQSESATATPPAGEAAEESDPAGQTGQATREQAEQAALAAVGAGQVTWSGREDDRGAAWEVEVTRPDGSEVDVLVAADGSIVKQVERFTGSPESTAGSAGSSGGEVSREEAGRIAVESVGGGQVTWSGREDDRGATWEIEVTRPDGSEVDVLIDAAGNVVP